MRTDADGRFHVGWLQPGIRHDLEVSDPEAGYGREDVRALEVPAADVLVRLPEMGRLGVHVLDPSGAPVRRSEVELIRHGPRGRVEPYSTPVNESSEGALHFRGLRPGTYHLRADALGYRPRMHGPLPVRPGDNSDVSVRLESLPEEGFSVERLPDLLSCLDEGGLPSVQGRPYVRVSREVVQENGGWRGLYHEEGFLLREDDESFTVLHQLWPRTYRDSTARGGGPRPYRELDLRELVEGRLEEGVRSLAEQVAVIRARNRSVSQELELVLLARGAHQHGMETEATELVELAAAAVSPSSRAVSPARLEVEVRERMSRQLLAEAVRASGRPDVAWTEIRETLDRVTRLCPRSSQGIRARGLVEVIDEMIAREARHEPIPPGELETLPVEDRARELIHQLVTLEGRAPEDWRETGLYQDPRGSSSPAARLLALGREAVPALLEVVDDDRLTRSRFAGPRPRAGSGLVLARPEEIRIVRVGKAALEILSRIAGRRLETREQAEAWWWGEVGPPAGR